MKNFFLFVGLTFLIVLPIHSASACAVCFGDPNSQMTKGAIAGVLLLLGVVGSVLGGIVAVSFTWIARARQLEKSTGVEQSV